jgi:2-oxo-3-hexenedioate decarboxylase
MEQMGVHDMIFGVLTSGMNVNNEGEMSMSQFIHPRAEPEICFRVGKEIDRSLSYEEVRQYVDGVAPAIEIIDSRYKDFKFSLEDVVADNCSSSGYVVGSWSSPDRELTDLGIRIHSNGEVKAEGSSNAILGDPWESMVAATRLSVKEGYVIPKGAIILAGAATAAFYLDSGSAIKVEIDDLGSAQFKTVD